jgi:hypothetical protein
MFFSIFAFPSLFFKFSVYKCPTYGNFGYTPHAFFFGQGGSRRAKKLSYEADVTTHMTKDGRLVGNGGI